MILKSLTRYHLQIPLNPHPIDFSSLMHQNAIWVSYALDPRDTKLMESDNLIYQGQIRNGVFGIRVLGIAENKLTSPTEALSQIDKHVSHLSSLLSSGQGIEMSELKRDGFNHKDIKIWDNPSDTLIRLCVAANDPASKTDIKRLRTQLNNGVIPAVVPETHADMNVLIAGCPP